jgi:hypothetical protein
MVGSVSQPTQDRFHSRHLPLLPCHGFRNRDPSPVQVSTNSFGLRRRIFSELGGIAGWWRQRPRRKFCGGAGLGGGTVQRSRPQSDSRVDPSESFVEKTRRESRRAF